MVKQCIDLERNAQKGSTQHRDRESHSQPQRGCSLTWRCRGAVRAGRRAGGRVPHLSLGRLHPGGNGGLERPQGSQEPLVDVLFLRLEEVQQRCRSVRRDGEGEDLAMLVAGEAWLEALVGEQGGRLRELAEQQDSVSSQGFLVGSHWQVLYGCSFRRVIMTRLKLTPFILDFQEN